MLSLIYGVGVLMKMRQLPCNNNKKWSMNLNYLPKKLLLWKESNEELKKKMIQSN